MVLTTTEDTRRSELVRATIDEIGTRGTLAVTVGQIARRAGVSPALAFHYFGDKHRLFLAAMRSILSQYGREVRHELNAANGSDARIDAIVRASFGATNFRAEVVSAWLNFYVLAATDPDARRLLTIYQRRLRSNLRHELAATAGGAAPEIAVRIASLIDGLYLRAALNPGEMTAEQAMDHVRAAIAAETERGP